MPHSTKLTEENLRDCERATAIIEQYRKEHKLSYNEIGRLIGRTGKTINAIRSKKMRVSIVVARRLANLTGKAPGDILSWLNTAGLSGEIGEMVEDISELNESNLKTIRRQIRTALDSQEDS